MNVVAEWRNRARGQRCEYWRCENCGRFAGVRRAACTGCGQAMRDSGRIPLPRNFRALEASHAHCIVESMDQVSGRRPVMLVEARNGQLFALPLCETDAQHGPALVGETLELVVRRMGNVGSNDPISYGRKLAASAIVRLRLKKNSDKEG
jgi:hypothetical protein